MKLRLSILLIASQLSYAVADSYEQIATSNKLILNYDEAISNFEKALQVRKQTTGGNDLRSSAIMHEMGKIVSNRGFASAFNSQFSF